MQDHLFNVTTKLGSFEFNTLPTRIFNNVAAHFPYAKTAIVLKHISEVEQALNDEELLNTWLTDAERQRYSSYKLAKRRNEWLAGRLCAKQAAATFIPKCDKTDCAKIEINNEESGRPYALFPKSLAPAAEIHISISHSKEMALGFAADHHCGIDIQKGTDTLVQVKSRFCNDCDEAFLARFFSPAQEMLGLNLLWSAKEAIRKAFGHLDIPGFLQLRLVHMDNLKDGGFTLDFNNKALIVNTIGYVFDDYATAICLLQDK